MKIWLIKLVIIVAVVVGIAFYGYKNVSPYERCVTLKDDYARLAKVVLERKMCKKHSGRDYATCINGKLRQGCESLTHW